MKKNSFWSTQAGALTIAFIITMLGFGMILFGMNNGSEGLANAGFISIMIAMLISPIKVFFIDRK